MRLLSFSVTNYKVFKETFTIDFSNDSIIILTGRNNTGKSTILESINCFFQKETKAKTIPNDCFSDKDREIVLKAEFGSDDEKNIFIKKYKSECAPAFYDENGNEIKGRHELKEKLDKVLSNQPFYITPSMLPDDINALIQNIYSEILKGDLQKLEKFEGDSEKEQELHLLAQEYLQLRESYPTFLRKIKKNTDTILKNVSKDVSQNLKMLFSNEHLSLDVTGGESVGFSASDILKSTSSSVSISSSKQIGMPLSNQGTGLQRMSLIYLIQNMIEKKLMGDDENKLLLIDEPEAFLHPEAVRALSRSLYKIGRTMPLMISTHSPVLIDLSEKHTSIQVFRIGEKEAVQLFQSVNDQFDENDIINMKILNYIDSYVNEFFFANKVIIVEGDTEYIAFKHLAKENNHNIHIIRARGKATIVTLMKVLNQFNSQYDLLHDIDNHSKHSSTTLKAQLTNCKNIFALKSNENIRIFGSISNFENAMGIGDISNAKKTQVIHEILRENYNEGVESKEYVEAYKKVETLFKKIINREEQALLSTGFVEIKRVEEYDKLFSELILKKYAAEEKEKRIAEENKKLMKDETLLLAE
ncbi:ATP-dependent nuclease [Saccharibacillus kuerlensis]|uniref:ATP-dependent endonuclease n=1 Tax=Saccharibacillus kuerlensis TaxID=459527 RepID=A0ABQ2KYC3_9BACL|nr:AAA family ATPase [Saccharibacillus kuerlensis]GGN96830.1 ATP-dependent endonuclease [Saccharibacillus kuerlensis]